MGVSMAGSKARWHARKEFAGASGVDAGLVVGSEVARGRGTVAVQAWGCLASAAGVAAAAVCGGGACDARLCCGRPPVVVPTTHMQTAFHFLISNRTPSPLAAGAAAALLAGASTAISSAFSSAGPAERPSPAGCSAIFAIYVVFQAKGGLTRPVGGERKRSSVCESPCEQRPAVLVCRGVAGPGRAGQGGHSQEWREVVVVAVSGGLRHGGGQRWRVRERRPVRERFGRTGRWRRLRGGSWKRPGTSAPGTLRRAPGGSKSSAADAGLLEGLCHVLSTDGF